MKVAIIADLHDNLVNLERCLAWSRENGVGALIIAGDLTNIDTLAHLAENFSGPIYLARGNACNYDPAETKKYPQLKYLGRDGGVVDIGACRVGVCHEPMLVDNLLEEGPEIVFYGHSHEPWEEKSGAVKLVNPGTLAGMFNQASFAVYDTESKALELKILSKLKNGKNGTKS